MKCMHLRKYTYVRLSIRGIRKKYTERNMTTVHKCISLEIFPYVHTKKKAKTAFRTICTAITD